MRTKHIVLAVAIIIAAITQLQAQPAVETLNVDTLCYLGKGIAGEAGGAFFLPDGNIIALWKGIPTVIDSKTGTIIRNLEELPNQNVDFPALSADGRYFVAYSKKGTAIWDVNTGKVIKFITVANGYAFSPDGSKMYCTAENDSKDPGIIIEYDMNTLERIDRFCNDDFKSGDHIAISPDGQTLAFSVYKPQDNPYDEKTNQVILIDLKDKTKYTVLETLEPTIKSMEFSPDGKRIAFLYNGGNNNIYIYICNLETKEKKYIKQKDLSNLFGFTIVAIGTPKFLDNSIIYSGVRDQSGNQRYSFGWDIEQNRIRYLINFNGTESLSFQDSLILFCNAGGLIAYLNRKTVSVRDMKLSSEIYLQYSNNQLEYYSDKSFIGQSMVYDTTGKLIANLGSQPFFIGKNIIRINQPMMKGVYILTIKNGTEQNSYKFVVE